MTVTIGRERTEVTKDNKTEVREAILKTLNLPTKQLDNALANCQSVVRLRTSVTTKLTSYREEVSTNMALSTEEIADLMANSRTKGSYVSALAEFMASDEAGINPRDEWPMEFRNRKTNTIAQGFNNALAKLKDGSGAGIRVINRDNNVFLLNTAKVALAVITEDAEQPKLRGFAKDPKNHRQPKDSGLTCGRIYARMGRMSTFEERVPDYLNLGPGELMERIHELCVAKYQEVVIQRNKLDEVNQELNVLLKDARVWNVNIAEIAKSCGLTRQAFDKRFK